MGEREHTYSEERGGGLFEPDVVVPEQFFAALRRKAGSEGERRLVIAVLEDAINCFQKYLFARDNRGRQLFREAEEWIMDEDRGSSFAFQNICDILDLNPDYLRAGLRRWRERRLASAYASGRVRALRQGGEQSRTRADRDKVAEPLRKVSGD